MCRVKGLRIIAGLPRTNVQNQPNKATVFDVAKLAGVSIKTVSRVVNSEPNVRPATQERVDQAIAELNYLPSEAARRLARQRQSTISPAKSET